MAYEPDAAKSAGIFRQLAGLMLVSIACVGVLTIALSSGSGSTVSPSLSPAPRTLVVVAVLGGAFIFMSVAVALLLRAVRDARRFEREAANEANHLRGDLAAAEMVIQAEPALVIAWDHNGAASLLAHNLPDAPEDVDSLLRFPTWLHADSATLLTDHLDTMFRSGTGGMFVIRSANGASIEAACRVHGSRAYLKLRDAAGERLRFAELQQKYQVLARDTESNRALLDVLPMFVWFHGTDGQIDWANQAYVNAVDASSLDDVLSAQLELLESRDRAALRSERDGNAPSRKRVHMIIHGERRAFDLIAVPMENRIALFASDSEALEVAEGELSRQSAANEGTLDRVSTAVAIFGRDQHLTFYNEAYTGLWKLDPQWLDGKPRDTEILDQLRNAGVLPDSGNYRKWRDRLLEGYRTRAPHEDWWHLPNGRAIHLRAEPRPDGGMAYLYDDVTERLALERGYNEMINVQRETLDNLAEGVAVFAPDGRIRLFNPSFAEIWNLPPEALEKKLHIEEVIQRCRVLYDEAESWGKIHRSVATIADTREPASGQMVRLDDTVIAWTCIPLPDSATLLTFIDITDQMRVERALIERTEALEAADRLKNDFVSHVSYELRTPLTNIIGFSELLRNERTGPLNEKQREYLSDIHVSSNTLLTIVNDILDLATIDAGAFALSREPVFIADIIEDAVHGIREKLDRARIQLQVQVEPGINEVVADANRMKQVLFNLLSNAIGFSHPDSQIRLTCHRDDTMIVFAVIDDGVGIPLELQSKVFERFESNALGTRHRGAGLGLAIVKNLVELHGGTIALSSAPGRGSTFTVRIPASAAQRSFDLPDNQPAAVSGRGAVVDAA